MDVEAVWLYIACNQHITYFCHLADVCNDQEKNVTSIFIYLGSDLNCNPLGR